MNSEINLEQTSNQIEKFLQNKLEETKSKGYIIGLSGGIDSSTSCKLAVESVGKDKVKALILDSKTNTEENKKDAIQLAEDLGVKYEVINIDSVVKEFESKLSFEVSDKTRGNTRARVRMVYLYMFANEEKRLVLGTGNRSEIALGYFTKFGDGAVDLNPLADLYKTEVRSLARYLGLREKLITKPPTAGLWEDQSDEDELGASYEVIDEILKRLLDEEKSVEEISENLSVDKSEIERFKQIYESSAHKRDDAAKPDLRD